MRRAGLIAASILAATLASAPLLAQDQGGMNPPTNPPTEQGNPPVPPADQGTPADHSSMGGPEYQGRYREMMMKRQKIHEEMMGIQRETLRILRDLKNTPTRAQRERLDAMIKRMDEIIKEDKDMMMKKMREGWEKKEKAPMDQKMDQGQEKNQKEGY